ncbi:MAG: hypothetical protein IJO70_07050 [Lachnospiraceae bacterium]|nr:hypothetical protein [Lachnospiraceae bacterium]
MENLYIDDADFEPYNAKIAEIDAALEARLGKIIDELNNAATAVASGNFHDNLVTFVGKLTELQGTLTEFTSKMQTDANDFFTDMVELDENVVI